MDKQQQTEIIKKIKKGQYYLFEKIISEYQEKLYAFLLKIIHNPEEALDLCQETFFKAYRAIRSFKGRAAFSTWLFKIAYHQAINYLKKHKRINPLDKYSEIKSDVQSIKTKLETSELVNILEQILKTIQPKYRAALHLYYQEEKSYLEIANIMKIPLNTVKSHISRGKKLIKQQMVDTYQLTNYIY